MRRSPWTRARPSLAPLSATARISSSSMFGRWAGSASGNHCSDPDCGSSDAVDCSSARQRAWPFLVSLAGNHRHPQEEQVKLGALAAIVVAAAVPAGAQSITDGDTLKQAGITYRLWGIDAPEEKQVCPDGWPAGSLATTRLQALTAGRSIVCQEKDRDRYGRIVAICRASGEDLGAIPGAGGDGLGVHPFQRRLCRPAGRGSHRQPGRAWA
jgi:endonuclease YncB( thermonuclease family)